MHGYKKHVNLPVMIPNQCVRLADNENFGLSSDAGARLSAGPVPRSGKTAMAG